MRFTELTDSQWNTIQTHLPKPARTGRPRCDDRTTINAILFVLVTGCRWTGWDSTPFMGNFLGPYLPSIFSLSGLIFFWQGQISGQHQPSCFSFQRGILSDMPLNPKFYGFFSSLFSLTKQFSFSNSQPSYSG